MAKTVMKDGEARIFIFTVRDVKAGEELTYDYQFKKDSSEYLECRCKAENCQKRLNWWWNYYMLLLIQLNVAYYRMSFLNVDIILTLLAYCIRKINNSYIWLNHK